MAKAGPDDVPDDLRPLLEQAIGQLAAGVRVCGLQAGLDDRDIEDEVRALGPQAADVPETAATHWDRAPLAVFAISAIVEDRLRRAPVAAVTTTTVTTVEALDGSLPLPVRAARLARPGPAGQPPADRLHCRSRRAGEGLPVARAS